MRKLQMHEYLDLLREGTDQAELTAAQLAGALQAARALWPALAVGAWPEGEMAVAHTVRARAGGKMLAHLQAGPPDCFLILVFPAGQAAPESYIHFDIGAQYTQTIFICPALSINGPAEEAAIRQAIPRLPGQRDPFAILESRGGTYLQVYAEGEGFELEHQLVNTASHYRLVGNLTAEEATAAFLSYAFGKYEWAHKHPWEKFDI